MSHEMKWKRLVRGTALLSLGLAALGCGASSVRNDASIVAATAEGHVDTPEIEDGSLVFNTNASNGDHTSNVVDCDGQNLRDVEFSSTAVNPNIVQFAAQTICPGALTLAEIPEVLAITGV